MQGQNSNTPVFISPIIKVDGTPLSVETMNQLVEMIIDSSLDVPDMVELRFHDDEYTLIDGSAFDLGKSIEVGFKSHGDQPTTVMKGEITALEPYYDDEMNAWFTVRAYDKRHRLNRGTKVRMFLNKTDSEIVQEIVQEVGLSAQVVATSVSHKYVCQNNQTDLEFIQERARLNGYEVVYSNDKLQFRPFSNAPNEVRLVRGETLRSFSPRLSGANQVNEVEVRGWDVQSKREIVGTATSSTSHPTIGYGKAGGPAAQAAFNGQAKYIETRFDINEAQAQKLAKSLLDDINATFVEAEGMTFGEPKIVAGCVVNLEKLGTRFSGKYVVTSATHIYSQEGYNTIFRVEGKKRQDMARLVEAGANSAESNRWWGVVPAIVTNNNDPDNLARVKLKFPWLAPDKESNWARLASLGAGNDRGIWFMPEVNDEVLVAFEQGDFNRPVVLGGLWNGQDAMPETTSNTVKSGSVVRRVLKTRTGHIIRFVDDSGDNYIEIIDSKQGTTIKLDAQNKTLDITCQGDITVKSTGNTKVEATGNLDMKATGNISVKGSANVNVEATGQLVLKGSMVNIN